MRRFILITSCSTVHAEDIQLDRRVLLARGASCFVDTDFIGSGSPVEQRTRLLIELVNSVAVVHPSCPVPRMHELAYLCWYLGVPMVRHEDIPLYDSITEEWVDSANIAAMLTLPEEAAQSIALQHFSALGDVDEHIARTATLAHDIDPLPRAHNYRMSVVHTRTATGNADHYSLDAAHPIERLLQQRVPGTTRPTNLRERVRRLHAFALSCERKVNAFIGPFLKNPQSSARQQEPEAYRIPQGPPTTTS